VFLAPRCHISIDLFFRFGFRFQISQVTVRAVTGVGQ
jgi:hypothetical protein